MNATPIILALALAIPSRAAVQKDKIQHFVGGSLISLVATSAAQQAGWKHPRAWGIGAAVGVGLLKELADSRKGGTGFDPADLGATALGGVTVQFVIRF
jgi:uncharacterized protein YfiM (DUF2279 family)